MPQISIQRRGYRVAPAIIFASGMLAAFIVWKLEIPFLEPVLLGIGFLTLLILGLWSIFFTGLRARTRWILLGAAVVLLSGIALVVAQFTRVEGSIGGSGIPRLVWKWSPKNEGPTNSLALSGESAVPASANATNLLERTEAFFPQFLGPLRSGMLEGVVLGRDWNTSPPKLLWRQPVGLGWSAFAVAGRRAITQEQRGGDELVVCYDLQTGAALWAHTNRAHFSEMLGGDGPRATPTIDRGRVYVMGATGILDCLDLASGLSVWTRDVLGDHGLSNLTWGKSCSPLLAAGLVVVTGGKEREKSLLAYEAETGKPAWQAGRDGASYCSPMLATLAGQQQILIVNAHSVSGHHPTNGHILWEYPWPGDYAKVTQPLALDSNRVFVAAGYGIGCVLLQIEPSPSGEWSAQPVWKNRNLKPKFTNLVRRGHHVYGLDDGVLACVSLEEGKREWKEGRYGHGQVLLVGELLLVQAESGDVALLEINPQGTTELARYPALKGKTWNNPVLINDLLLVRNDREAACYRLPLESVAR